MKRQAFEAREWKWDPDEMEDSVEYDVKAILGVSLKNGLRSYRVQWSDLTEGWDPEEALVNVQGMLLEFHAAEDKKAAEGAGKRGSGRVAKAKKQKKQVVVEESDEDSDEAERSSSKTAKTGDAMQQCMMLMANSVAASANLAATKADTSASKDGADHWQAARDAGPDGRLQEAETGGHTALHARADDAKADEVGDDGRTPTLREEVQQADGCSVGGGDAKDGMRLSAAGSGGDSRAADKDHREGSQVDDDYGGVADDRRHFGFAAGVLR